MSTIGPGITIGPPQEAPHELLARMRVELPPQCQTVMDATVVKQKEILANTKFTDRARQELVDELQQQARMQLDAEYEQVDAARQKELDREEGQARRELLDPAPTHDIIAGERERLETVAKQVHGHAALTAV